MNFTELFAAACGLIGTLLLALKGRHAGYGFVAFLASNAGWLAFSYAHGHWAMFVQQIGFTISSLIGIWIWVICPRIHHAFDALVKEGRIL